MWILRDRHAAAGEMAEVQSGGATKDTRAGSGDEDDSGDCNGIASVIHELCMNGMCSVGVVYRGGRKQEDAGGWRLVQQRVRGSLQMEVEMAGMSGKGRREASHWFIGLV